MKKLPQRLILLLCSIVLVFSSCEDENMVRFAEDGDAILLKGNVLERKLIVDSEKNAWDLKMDEKADWLFGAITEDGVQLVVEPNFTGKLRTSRIYIMTRGKKASYVTIEQEAATADLLISTSGNDNWKNYHETQHLFAVGSVSSWDASSNASWLKLDVATGKSGTTKVVASFTANMAKEKREATITVKMGDKETQFKVIQRGKKEYTDATHYVYVSKATFPALYSGIDMLNNEKESLLLDSRKTFIEEHLPQYVTLGDIDYFPANVVDFVRSIESENPDAVYAYCTEDIRVKAVMPIFTRLGIDSSRVKVTIYPDGAATYLGTFNEPYGSSGAGGEAFKKREKELEKYYTERIANPSIGKAETQIGRGDELFDTGLPHVFSLYNQCRFYIQDVDYLITNDTYVKEKIKANNYIVKAPSELFADLPADKQKKFLAMTGFDKDVYKAQLDASPKPNLIILGTNTEGDDRVQAKAVQAVMDEYSATYDIFYKAHPADPAYVNYESKFPGLKLIMPAKLPFEVFVWGLDADIHAMGGFNSTIFLAVPIDKVKFMFAKDAASLGVVHESIFKDRDDIYWIN